MNRYILIFLFVLYCAPSLAQEFRYKIYATEKGLLQNQIESVYQDSKGYLWFGSKLGVSRFDGKNFQNYSISDGLIQDDVEQIAEDSHNNLWFRTDQGLMTFRKDSFLAYPAPENARSVANMYISGDSVFVLNKLKGGGKRVMYLYKGRYHFADLPKANYEDFVYFSDFDGFLLQIDSLIKKWTPEKGYSKSLWKGENLRMNALQDKIFIIKGSKVYRYPETTWPCLSLDKPVSGVLHAGDSFFLNMKNSKSLHEYTPEGKLIRKYRIPKTRQMTVDNFQVRWFGTEKGIYKLSSVAFRHYSNEDMQIKSWIWTLVNDRGHLWAGTYGGKLLKLESGKARHYNLPVDVDNFYFPSYKKANNAIVFATKRGLLIKESNSYRKLHHKELKAVLAIFPDKEKEQTLFGTGPGLVIKRENKLIRYTRTNNKWDMGPVTAINKDTTGNYWLSTREGLAAFNGSSFSFHTDSFLKYGAFCILHDHKHNLWFGGTGGLFFYNNHKFKQLAKEAFTNRAITGLHTVGDTLMLIGTTSGMAIMDLEEYYANNRVRLKTYDQGNGFTGYECQQNGFTPDNKGNIWLPVTHGIVKIRPELLSFGDKPPVPQIQGIETAQDMQWVKHQAGDNTFSHNEKILRINFNAPPMAGQVNYSYKLEGHHKQQAWSIPQNSENVVFRELPHGEYTFKVKAIAEGGLESPTAATLHFSIKKALWQRTLVQTTALLLFFGLGFLTWILYHRHKQKKREEQRRIAHQQQMLMMQAHMAQLDPHFIFNTLTSTGTMALRRDYEEAYQMIVQLASLLRRHWKKGHKLIRPLHEELKLVEEYLNLSAKSHSHSFSYKITIAQDVDTSVYIIKLSIQNFVENAIKHGLENISEHGYVYVRVERQNGHAVAIVEDNGIGYQSTVPATRRNNGTGLKTLQKAMEIYNSWNEEKMFYQIVDKRQIDAQQRGTIVKMFIPLSFRYS